MFVKKYLPGILLSFGIAAVSIFLGSLLPLIGSSVLAIVLGIVLNNSMKLPAAFQEGLSYSGKKLLQYSIIFLGFSMSIGQVSETGLSSLRISLITILIAFLAAYLVGRFFKMNRVLTILIGFGTAICGGSAIAAVAPVIGAKDRDVVISIATIFLFNVLAVFIFPFLGHTWGMTDTGFGMWAGTAINDTSSVVAAGYAYSAEAGAYATIVKLTRTLMIVPVCLFFALMMMRGAQGSAAGFSLKRIFPMFVLYFIVACLINTSGILPAAAAHTLGTLGKFAIVLAMSALGLNTDLAALLRNGLRPLALGMVCWIAVAGTSLLVQHALGLL